MNKIIKITDNEIIVGKDDGEVLKLPKSSCEWNAKIGDFVDVFKDGDSFILSKSVNFVEKKDCKFVECLVKSCKKILPIIFSSLFGLFLILTIVLTVMPHGKLYKYNAEIFGIKVYSEISLSGNKITVKNYYDNRCDRTESTFEIKNKKIYTLNQETNQYAELGTISSTKIVTDSGDNFEIVYVETCVKAWKNVGIVFMIIFAVLDVASIVVLILNKKGIIKIKSEGTKKSTDKNKDIANEKLKENDKLEEQELNDKEHKVNDKE